MHPVELDIGALAAAAREEYVAFAQRIAVVPYERKGILFSEMFFFSLCAKMARPQRILESGRARGQSTLLLALCFPELEIVSVEHNRDSSDSAVAAKRLRGRENVRLVFGDATRLLPAIAREGDIALIDGPKGYRGLRLAIRLLASARLPLVFLHDTGAGTMERRFLQTRFPEAAYSGEIRFAEVAHSLDGACQADIPDAHRWQGGPPAGGYGFSLACLPWRADRNYGNAMAWALWDGLAHRLRLPAAQYG